MLTNKREQSERNDATITITEEADLVEIALIQTSTAVPLARSTAWQIVVTAYLAAAIDSPHTRRAYRRLLADAMTALGVQSVGDVTGAQLAAYRALVTTSGKAPASQGLALAALRSFLTWARTMGAHVLPAEVIAAALRTPRASVQRPYSVLSEPEIGAILAAAALPRDRALLAVLLGAGLRCAEAVALDTADLLEDADGAGALYVRQGKGRKDRTVPLQPDVLRLVRAYLAAGGRRLGDAGPLFLRADRAHDAGRLSTRAAGYVVARVVAAAQIDAKRISPHSLRHTFALRALRHGANVIAVSKLLGHSSITTTQRYVDHLAVAELRAAVPTLPAAG